jgi:hypothetical protein
MLLLYIAWDPAGPVYTLVPPSWCPRPPRHKFQTASEGLRKWSPNPAGEIAFLWTKIGTET